MNDSEMLKHILSEAKRLKYGSTKGNSYATGYNNALSMVLNIPKDIERKERKREWYENTIRNLVYTCLLYTSPSPRDS